MYIAVGSSKDHENLLPQSLTPQPIEESATTNVENLFS
jgi:hypothetical protein